MVESGNFDEDEDGGEPVILGEVQHSETSIKPPNFPFELEQTPKYVPISDRKDALK